MCHEHVLIDMSCWWRQPPEIRERALAESAVEMKKLGTLRRNPLFLRDNMILNDLDLAIEELMEFRKLGGGTVVDVTLPDIGRDPRALQVASRMTGLHIIAGCGHYVYLAHPAELEEESVDSVADRFVRELTEGIGATGVRPGIIGEIGTSEPLHPREEKVLRAAARAHKATGVPITLHPPLPVRKGEHIVGILKSEGVNPERIVMGHLDFPLGHVDIGFSEAIEYLESVAELGCYLEFDCCGGELYQPELGQDEVLPFWMPSDRVRAEAIARLCQAGYGDRILLSQDICKKMDLVHYGGFGYGHVLRNFAQSLLDFGLEEKEINRFLIENPQRMLIPQT